MATYRVRTVMPYVTNLPRDVAVNTFHCWAPVELLPADLDQMALTFTAFYTATGGNPSGQALGAWLSTQITRASNACRTEVYALADPEPRPPVASHDFTMSTAQTGAGVANLPLECAVVNSFQAPRLAGVPQSRRRGRIYFGPLRTSASTGGNPPLVQPSLQDDLLWRSEQLRQEVIDDVGALWVVLSRVNGDVAAISNGWVDDDMDTQRRRGLKATARKTWDTP